MPVDDVPLLSEYADEPFELRVVVRTELLPFEELDEPDVAPVVEPLFIVERTPESLLDVLPLGRV